MRHGAAWTKRFVTARPPRLIAPTVTVSPLRWSSTNRGRTWSTPLAKTIADAIETTGPISIAAYMRQCLTSPQGGYYTTTREQSDQFGKKGDFITSPEISQVFGELVGIWFLTEWLAQGQRSSGVQLIEVGPGRGTLMDDILRTVASFKKFTGSIETVYLVEASDGLREAQRKVLCGVDQKMEKTDVGWTSMSKHGNVPVTWVEDITLLPQDIAGEKSPFIVAHEFFDALPIYAFTSVRPPLSGTEPTKVPVATQWRELLVNTNEPQPTTAISTVQSKSELATEFSLTTAPRTTPNSLLLPESSQRYKALKALPGSTIEVSAESNRYISEFAHRIGRNVATRKEGSIQRGKLSGAALIIDYGPSDTVPINSLRGIKNHNLVSPFSEPGRVDLSADVDFTALAEAACQSSPGVEVWGPVEQGDFLTGLGGQERVKMLLDGLEKRDGREEVTAQKKKEIETGWGRLIEKGGGGMGRIYKVLALVPENGGRRRPVGFGGAVEGK